MDWNMVSNAEGPLHRVQTLSYLLQCRYGADACEAGQELWAEAKVKALCRQVLEELRVELVAPSGNLGSGGIADETTSRRYLRTVLDAFDESATSDNSQ